ncbi:MAG: DUF1566 domain-containing protein, partial [Candidatus Symbiothrix sp.]|nr:DUF1566 domain-containing protein [Candidatus Symbiothrix sp.]
TRANELKAELYAVYEGNQSTVLTLRVSDCQYCPGLLVVGGEYNYIEKIGNLPDGSTHNNNGSAANALLNSNSVSKSGSDLCYYKRDANSSSSQTDPLKYVWSSAITICQSTQGIDAADAHIDWRLPNLAELAQIGELVSDNGDGTINSGVGSQTHVNAAINQGPAYAVNFAFPANSYTTSTGTSNLLHFVYWSSTEYTNNRIDIAWPWNFAPSYRYSASTTKSSIAYVRCVRPF